VIEVILIDDERAMRESIRQWLELEDCRVRAFGDAREAIDTVGLDYTGVVVTDLRMPDLDGLGLLALCRERDPDIPVIVITGHGDVGSAVEAMRAGAYDFIEKPFRPERLLASVTRAADRRRLLLEHRALVARVAGDGPLEERLIGRCAAMRRIRRQVVEFAARDVDVLLVGETGTGKEVIARCLHELGPRAEKPFLPIDCGAIPADRFERELFGVAPLDGVEGVAGPFERADGGTVLLDEIVNLPTEQQVKLLRVLETRQLQRVGASASIAFDVRLVSAANGALPAALADGSFRRDLYFRLNTIEIAVPPLQSRDDDALALFEHFVARAARRHECALPDIASEDVTAIHSHVWPGNVRELVNIAERFVLYGGERVASLLDTTKTSAASLGRAGGTRSLTAQVQHFERSLIEFALGQAKGNLAEAAGYLGVPRRTLNDKLLRHEIERERFRDGAEDGATEADEPG